MEDQTLNTIIMKKNLWRNSEFPSQFELKKKKKNTPF